MKKTSLILAALFGIQMLASPTAHAQGVYNRAKSMARRVAPSPNPAPPVRSSPYQMQPSAAPAGNYAQPVQGQLVPGPRPSGATTKELPEEVVRKTVEFQKKRADEGSPAAQYDLGMRYIKGDGVERDEEAGLKWLDKSAKNGSNQAVKKLKEFDDLKKEGADLASLIRPKKDAVKVAVDAKKDAPAAENPTK